VNSEMRKIAASFVGRAVAAAWRRPFRGEVYEYAAKLNLQAGYSVKGAVDMNTLRHLLWPLRALRAPWVRLVSLRGAVQTTKSLCADIWVPYLIEHDPGDLLWLLEDDKKAREYAARCLTLIKSVPEIAAMLQDVDTSDKTKTRISFRHMQLLVCGLNAGNVQSLSWRYVIVDETWLHPWDGLIRQAMDRTKQYPNTSKVLLIGQGGWDGDDHDREHRECQQWELGYRCPECGRAQAFEQSRERPADFELEALRGKFSGLSWDTNEVTRPGGRWDWDAVKRSAHHRCYFCDARIEDRPEVRRALNDGYCYLPGDGRGGEGPAEPVFAERVAFHWPGEASMRVPFGDLAVKYLKAKIAAEEQGYKLPLQEYWQKDRGCVWSDTLEGDYREIVKETYDPKAEWSEGVYKFLIVDCQRDLKKFYFTVFLVAQSGESRELERGMAASFEDIAKIQDLQKIKDQHVFLDCSYRMTEVLRECVKHGHVATVKLGKGKERKVWRCWIGLKGSGYEMFRHKDPVTGLMESKVYSERKWYDLSIGMGKRSARAPWYEWSNLHCKDLLRMRRDAEPGVPAFLSLPDTLPPTDQNSYFAMMRSERRQEDYAGGRKRSIWVPVSKTRPNHYWDIGGMLMAVESIVGIIGQAESVESADPPPP